MQEHCRPAASPDTTIASKLQSKRHKDINPIASDKVIETINIQAQSEDKDDDTREAQADTRKPTLPATSMSQVVEEDENERKQSCSVGIRPQIAMLPKDSNNAISDSSVEFGVMTKDGALPVKDSEGEKKDSLNKVTSSVNGTNKVCMKKYYKMKRIGVSAGSIRQKMIIDGCEEADIERVLNSATRPSQGIIPPQSTTKPLPALAQDPMDQTASQVEDPARNSSSGQSLTSSDACGPLQPERTQEQWKEIVDSEAKYSKYLKMHKMGVHPGAISNSMARDGLKDDDQQSFLLAYAPTLAVSHCQLYLCCLI